MMSFDITPGRKRCLVERTETRGGAVLTPLDIRDFIY